MQDFIDLKGASGASYRFRRLPAGAPHLPIAGNYAVLRRRPGGFNVLHLGATNDLSEARSACPSDVLTRSAHFYTRLNVSRTAREAEHADLSANYGAGDGGDRGSA